MNLKFSMLAAAATAGISIAAAAQAQPVAATTPVQADSQPADVSPQADVKAQADTKATADTKSADVKAATKADVKAGSAVFDSSGNSVGKIDSVDSKGAVLNTGKVKVQVPLTSLAHGDKGLAIGMSKAEIEAAAATKKK